jgi:hypothetical protein
MVTTRATVPGLVVGLNEVTKCCVYSELSVILVCKEDIVPSMLVEHFPMIAFQHACLLVPLPKGASQRLQEMVVFSNMKRVSVLGIKTEASEWSPLVAFLDQKLKSGTLARHVHDRVSSSSTRVSYLPLTTFSK